MIISHYIFNSKIYYVTYFVSMYVQILLIVFLFDTKLLIHKCSNSVMENKYKSFPIDD